MSPSTPKRKPVMIFSRTSSGFVVGEKASGKTVRELSRLWRYLGGASPENQAVDPAISKKVEEQSPIKV